MPPTKRKSVKTEQENSDEVDVKKVKKSRKANEAKDEVSDTKKAKKYVGNKKSSKSNGAVEEEEEEKPLMKSVMVKGLAPVDADCPVNNTHHVYSHGADVWDAMLNQTNIQNNNNKFYIL